MLHPILDQRLNLDSMLIQLRPISDKFKVLGAAAGISGEALDAISANTEESYDALVEVCDVWLKSCVAKKIRPTWHLVAEMLTVIGQADLSNKILQVYETGK